MNCQGENKTNCHGCVYLDGEITPHIFWAKCKQGFWVGHQCILLGDIVYKPAECNLNCELVVPGQIYYVEDKPSSLNKTNNKIKRLWHWIRCLGNRRSILLSYGGESKNQ